MKTKTTILFSVLWACAITATNGQGTFIYDQESSNDEESPFSGAGLQFFGSVGQSFAPSTNGVGFVRLRYFDINDGNSLGATLILNLRSTTINGPIIGTTSLTLSDSFVGAASFIFPTTISVTAGSTYFLETLVQSGDIWGATVLGSNNYPNGIGYDGVQPFNGDDLWFREGIIVPEPSSGVLLLGGGFLFWLIRSKRRE